MNLNELREALEQRKVELWVEGDLLRFRMPGKSLDKTLLAELRRHKNELVESLKRDAPDNQSGSRLEPLSLGQQALYFLHSLSPQSSAYNVAASFRIASPVDIDAMRWCFQTLVSRHETLRTTIEIVDGHPRCRVHSHMEVDFRQMMASGWAPSQLYDAVREEYARPFDLKDGPLLRVRLFTSANDDHVFLMALHHIVFDAWSLWLLQDEFDTLYRHHSRGETAVLPTLTAGYSEFVGWQHQLQHSQRGETLWEYWRDRLQGDLVAPDVPNDYPRPDRPKHQGASHKFRVPQELSTGLRQLSKSFGATPFAVLLAIFKTLVFRYTGQRDLTIGTTTSGRSDSSFTRVVGYFVNTLAIRTELEQDATFADYLTHVKGRTLEAIEHQDYPFPLLVDRLNPRRDTGRLPICSVMFGLQKPQQFNEATRLFEEDPEHMDWGGLKIYPYDVPQQEGQFDLTLVMFDAKDSFLGVLKYDVDLFRAETADRMSRHFLQLVESIVDNPHRPISEYLVLSDEETELVRSTNSTDPPESRDDLRAHCLFEEQVRFTPDRIAAGDKVTTVTYGELNRLSNQLAHWLRQYGIKPGDAVATQASRGIDVAVAFLGILKAGGTYVPVDPKCPRQRAAHMLEDCQAKILLSHSRYHEDLEPESACGQDGYGVEYYCLDRLGESLAQGDAANPDLDFGPETLAYIIYTSGSTGDPKGVSVSHHALTQHILCMREIFGLVAKDCMLQFSNTTFDPSIEQMMVPWSSGASVFIRGDELWSPDEFWQVIQQQAMTTLSLPAPYFRHCSEALDVESGVADSLRLVVVGGDVFPMEVVPKWQSLGVRLLNAYGPTEAVVTATTHEISYQSVPPARMPIGRPKPGVRAYVLDSRGQHVPIGVPGELFLSSAMLANGYLNDPQITRERFLPDPFNEDPHARMYRTGDRVRWTNEGELEFLGRNDRQVKIHGYRVEIGEIELKLNAYPDIQESHVQCQRDSQGDAFLVAWLVSSAAQEPDADQIRGYLRDKLPGHMIPRQFVLVDKIPLNRSGKVDTHSLPVPKLERPKSRQYVAPKNAIEQTLVDIWSSVLEVERIGVNDNFFDLGGSSLTSLRIFAKLKESGIELEGDEIKPELLFEYPTVAELAEFWESCSSSPTATR